MHHVSELLRSDAATPIAADHHRVLVTIWRTRRRLAACVRPRTRAGLPSLICPGSGSPSITTCPGIASAATAVLIGHVAGHRSRIRVGAGGNMLPNHAPLQIAEQVGTLEDDSRSQQGLGLREDPLSDPPRPRTASWSVMRLATGILFALHGRITAARTARPRGSGAGCRAPRATEPGGGADPHVSCSESRSRRAGR
jgi:hypothetical protein